MKQNFIYPMGRICFPGITTVLVIFINCLYNKPTLLVIILKCIVEKSINWMNVQKVQLMCEDVSISIIEQSARIGLVLYWVSAFY